MVYLIILPDGVGVRNFLCTRFIGLLLNSGDVVIWHRLSASIIEPYRDHWGNRVIWEELPAGKSGIARDIFTKAMMYARLYSRQGKYRSDRVIDHFAQITGLICASAHGLRLLERMRCRAFSSGSDIDLIKGMLKEVRPGVTFCTHQRMGVAAPSMFAARNLGIPTASFIYSWDNVPKGEMNVYAETFLVWSQFMRDEMVAYHPEVASEQLIVTGTPQFEHYFDKSLCETREVFLRRFGLDPQRPVICFSGDDVLTSPFDPSYLADVALAVRQIRIERRPQILFRRCPVDTTSRYAEVLAKHPEIVVCEPRWTTGGSGHWFQVVPTRADIGLLVNIALHSAMVINLGSTMAMDFAIYDKPAVYLAYQPLANGSSWKVTESYRQPHFTTVHELQPVHWARSKEDLGPIICSLTSGHDGKSAARKAWLQRVVAQPMDRASERCCEVLERLSRSNIS